MMHATDSALDLSNDPWMVVLIFGALAAIIWITAAPYREADRIERNDHAVAEGQPGPDHDARAARAGGADHLEVARADRGEQADSDRLVHRSHGLERDRRRARLGGLSAELDRTDDGEGRR